MRENRDGGIQTGGALAGCDQKAKEHADGRGALFRRSPSAPLTGIQDKPPQVVSVKLVRILSEALQQIAQVEAVIIGRGIAGARCWRIQPQNETNRAGSTMISSTTRVVTISANRA